MFRILETKTFEFFSESYLEKYKNLSKTKLEFLTKHELNMYFYDFDDFFFEGTLKYSCFVKKIYFFFVRDY